MDLPAIASAARDARQTLYEQAQVWKKRSVFERLWIFRDFKKVTGMAIEEWLNRFDWIETAAIHGERDKLIDLTPPVSAVADYYRHMAELAKSYTRDETLLASQLESIEAWIQEADVLHGLLTEARHEGQEK